MRTLFIISILLYTVSFTVPAEAQSKRVMLLDEYSNGTVFMKNRQKVAAKLNYDTANKKMMYIQNNNEMILVNNAQIDSVVISNRKFVQLLGTYLEVVEVDDNEIFIDWSFKNIYKGKKGAYGQVTQTKVETINTSFWTNNEYKNESADVYEHKNNNTYWFFISNKAVKCRNIKDLIKLFPENNTEINDFVKNNNIDFSIANDAVKLIGFCLKY